MAWVLEVVEGDDAGRRFALAGADTTLGRSAENDVALPDPRVSRRHLVLRRAGGALMVEDAGSTGGTRVNGAQIDGPTPLAAGDRVGCGRTELALRLVPDDVAAALAASARAAAAPSRSAVAGAVAGLVGGAMALAGAWLPFSGDNSLWDSGEGDIRVQAVLVPALLLAVAVSLLAAVLLGASPLMRDVESSLLALLGATAAGPAVVGLLGEFDDPGAGLFLALAGGVVAAAGGLVAMHATGRERGPARDVLGRGLPAALGALAGGGLMAAASPLALTRVEFIGETLEGLSGAIPVGRAFLVLGVAAAVAGALLLALLLASRPAGTGLGAVLVAAGGALGVGLAGVAFLTFPGSDLRAGPVLALAGGLVAAAGAVAGLVAVAARPPSTAGSARATRSASGR